MTGSASRFTYAMGVVCTFRLGPAAWSSVNIIYLYELSFFASFFLSLRIYRLFWAGGFLNYGKRREAAGRCR